MSPFLQCMVAAIDRHIMAFCSYNLPNLTIRPSFLASVMSHQRDNRGTVAIVGAGMAGIAAARRLVNNGFDVIVLEANPSRYGGRIYSVEVPGSGGKAADMGAMWLHGGCNPEHPLTRLCHQYGIQTLENKIWKPENSMAFDEHGNGLSEEDQTGAMNAVLRLQEIVKTAQTRLTKSDLPDLAVRALLDQVAKDDPDFVKQEAMKSVAIQSFEAYYGGLVDDLSVKFIDGIPDGPDFIEYLDEDTLIPAGYMVLLDKIATVGPSFPIILDRRVEQVKIDHDKRKVHVISSDHQNRRYHNSVDHVVVAVPLGVLKARSIHFDPSLSLDHLKAIDRIGFGSKIKVLLVYSEPFWPDVELLCADSQYWPMLFLNMRKVNGLNGLMAMASAVQSNLMDVMSESAIVDLVDLLTRTIGKDKMSKVKLIFSQVAKWSSDPLFRGVYSFGKIGMCAEDAYAIRRPISPFLFFAGEHTQMPNGEPGTVLAAYESGKRVADEIMALYDSDQSNRKVPSKSKL